MPSSRDGTLAVIIASANRASVLHESVLSLLDQCTQPAQIVLAVPGPDHVAEATNSLPGVTVVISEAGLTKQRNRGVAALPPAIEITTFLDDDTQLRDDYLFWIARAFREHADVVLVTGRVLADGVRARTQLSRTYARGFIGADTLYRDGQCVLSTSSSREAYGCNMSVRRTIFDTVRFDERLPLYGWMEDLDFASQCARHGCLVRCENARLVHLGVTSGRLPGRRHGFSQVMNPIYLWRKGSITSPAYLAKTVLKPLLANTALSLAPGQTVDRRGRLAGNCRALAALLRGRIAPEDMLKL